MNSLERSLQAGLVVSLVALMLVFLWAGSLTGRLLGESFVHRELGREAESVVAALDYPPIELARPRLAGNARLDPAYDEPLSGRYFIVRLEPDGTRIESRSAWDQRIAVPRLAPGQQLKRRALGVSGEPLQLWLGGFSKGGHEFTVALAEDVGPIESRLEVFRWYFAGISLVLLVALLVVQHLIVRRSVQKLDAIRGELERLEHGQAVALSEDVPSEIMPLVREFNRLLSRFDQRTRLSRNAVGNLAHALKGPLSLLLRSARAAESRSPAGGAAHALAATERGAGVEDADTPSREAIAQNAERIARLIESELRRARLAGRGTAGQLFDLDIELPSLTGLLEQVYSDKAIDIRWNIAHDVELVQDRQDMLELVGNLLDNAVKWARSVVMLTVRTGTAPAEGGGGAATTAGGRVAPASGAAASGTAARAARALSGVYLDVEDDGPGCTAEELARLTERGVRLDESVVGYGLGLSIVKDIVDTYGGRLELGRSSRLGGFRATVHLPSGG